MPKVHKTAHKGLLRLPKLFPGIQEKVVGHDTVDSIPRRRLFLRPPSNYRDIRSHYRDNSASVACRINNSILHKRPSAPLSIAQAIILCAIVLVFKKIVTALFSNKCVEDFIPKQRHVEVQIDKSASRKFPYGPKEPFAVGWRSM